MPNLSAYLPQDRLRALSRGESLPDRATGAALFADISGFTPLTAALSKELGRKRGAEQVLDYINPVYEALITELHSYGGSVICFSGDAITCWFDDAPRALTCAFAMQAAMRQFSTVYTPAGAPVTMGVKVTVAAGPIRRFLVGNPAIHVLETLAGSTLERMAAAEHHANKGEVVIDEQTFRQLNDGVLHPLTALEWRSGEDGQRYALLGELSSQAVRAPWPAFPVDMFSETQVRPWILPAVFARSSSGGGLLGDLRPVSSLFLKFGGIDYDNDESAGDKLDAYVNWVQAIVHRYNGSLLQLTIGDKGSNMFICFGAPITHEDDPHRITTVALALQNPPGAFDYIGKVQIGITRGEVWTGACGAATRHYYGVMGNEVNMAARLMVRAAPGQILTTRQVADITADRFQFRALGEIQVKGRVEPLAIAEITGEIHPETATAREQTLVGRKSELQQMAAALSEVEAGQNRIICLDGEAGMGKSRLVSAFLEVLQARGLDAFAGLGQSIEQNTPYRAWRDLLGAFFGLDVSAEAAARLDQVQRTVARLVPGQIRRLPLLNDILHLGLPENELTAYLSPELRQQSLTLLVLNLLRASASQKPPCLVLEDAQWLDALSWELTLQVARGLQASKHPMLLVLVTRPLDERDSGANKLTELRSLPATQTISLKALSPQEITALVAAHLGLEPAALPGELAELVRANAEGNPFFAQELVFALRDQGVLKVAGGHCEIHGELARPGQALSDNLQGVILTRIDRLPPERQAALKMAAVIGRSFAYPTLQHTYPIPSETLLNQLATLVEQDMLLPQTPQPGLSYLFKHIITQEVAYQTLLFDQRKRIHRSVAEWYESTFTGPGELAAYLPLLVHHYHHAEDAEKERHYARLAGDQAVQQGDQANAVAFFRRALALTPVTETDTRFELLLAREQANDRLGARPQQAEDLAALEKLTQDQPHKRAQLFLRQANYAEATSNFPAAIAAAEQAIAALQTNPAPDLLARAETAWGEALRLQGEYAAAQTHLEQAVARLRPLGAGRSLATALRKLGVVARNRGDTTLATACYAESLALSRAAHDPEGEAATLNNLGAAAIKQSDYAGAQQHFQPALKLYQDLGDQRKEAGVLNNLALVVQAQNQLEAAQVYRQQALSIYREIGDRQGQALVLTNLGSTSTRQGNYAQAGEYHQQALEIHREIGDRPGEAGALNNLGLVAVAQNEPIQAQNWFDLALAIYRQTGNRLGEANALSNLGALSTHLGDTAAAREHYQRALEIYRAIGNRQREAAIISALEKLGEV